MTPNERSLEAKRLLENGVLAHAFEDIRRQFVDELEAIPRADLQGQHEIALCLQLLKRIRAQIARYADENAVDAAKRRHEQWVEKTRESITSGLSAPR